MTVANNEGSIEIHPGPRGHSVVSVGVTPDGRHARFTTDEPRTLNPIPLPEGPQGVKGNTGAPGEGKIVTDETAGHRVFMWDARLSGHQMAYGDTGVRLLEDGTTWVRRTDNLVETNALDPATDLPEGFRPVSPEAVSGVFTTGDEWPTTLPGTEQRPPVQHYGLRDYEAAVSAGYPGTPEEWLNAKYRVLLPPAGAPGQFLARTAAGSAWQSLPLIGPGPWANITLDAWKPGKPNGTEQVAQSRTNNGTTELNGHVTYTGPQVDVGLFTGFQRIGVLAPGHFPTTTVDLPVMLYGGSGARPHVGHLRITTGGVMFIFATTGDGSDATVRLFPGATEVNLTGVSFPAR